MPSRFIKRDFRGNSYYHVYNCGVEGRVIFQDSEDFKVFLFYLYIYTTPPELVIVKYPKLPRRLRDKNLSQQLKLLGYCLMPDHFHLLVGQTTKDALPKLMKQVINGYTVYFNQKYKRLGALMQGRYKAAFIADNELLTQMWRFLHLNPVTSGLSENPKDYEWSSYDFFVGKKQELKCSSDITDQFSSLEEIQKFHLDKADYDRKLYLIKDVTIDQV